MALFFGYDPGGYSKGGKNGVVAAEIERDGTFARPVSDTLQYADEVIAWFRRQGPGTALGVDTLLAWSFKGDRACDKALREWTPYREPLKRYSGKNLRNVVMRQNKLEGAMAINGVLVATELQKERNLWIVESHPKVLVDCVLRESNDPILRGVVEIFDELKVQHEPDDHRADAFIAAWCASRSYFQDPDWQTNLYGVDTEDSLFFPAGPAVYPWPEAIRQAPGYLADRRHKGNAETLGRVAGNGAGRYLEPGSGGSQTAANPGGDDPMDLHKLTRDNAGRDVAPPSADDREGWDEWVSATKTRGYLLANTLEDWLHRYGEEHGFEKDPTPDERLDLRRFNMKQGIAFEEHVAGYLAQRADLSRITTDGLESRDPEKARATVAALEAGCEIVHGGVLWNPETRTYGIPDFLIRSDVFERLFPNHPDPYEGVADSRGGAGSQGGSRYVVVDAKFTTLHLFAEPVAGRKPRKGARPGEINNDGSSPAYRAQLFLYNAALARLQGCAPRRAFLLGRGWKQGGDRGSNAMERLGPVSMTAELAEATQEAVCWIRRLRKDGANWRVLPEPSLPELRPPSSGDADRPWKGAIQEIIEKLEDPVRLWQVGPPKRDKAAAEGITSWRDPRATAASLGVHGGTTAPMLEAILDVNRTEGPVVRPERITAAEDAWRPRPGLEFFVDFETVNDINDDFSRFPERGGQPLIFMIGCGHVEDGEWRFSCFVADRLTAEAEATAIDSWIEHMRAVRRRLGVTETPLAFHWAHAEQSTLEKAYNSACKRHPGKSWADSADFAWFDLLNNVVKAQPVVVRGAFGFGLKEIAKTLHGHGFIETSWDDSPVDGQGAMVGAWHCDREAAEKGARLADTGLMKEIQHYNQVDCRVMEEIVDYLRANH